MIRGDENNLSYTGKGLQFTMVFMFFIVHCLQSRMAYFQLSKITIQFQRPLRRDVVLRLGMERELDSGLIAGYKDNLCKIYFLDYILYSLSIQQDVVTVDVCVLNSTTVNLSLTLRRILRPVEFDATQSLRLIMEHNLTLSDSVDTRQ